MTESSPARRWSRRLLLAAAAQAASSATNLALYLGLIWLADPVEFGRWVAVLAVHHLVVALARSLVSEPIVAAAPGPGSDVLASAVDGPFTWAWGRRRLGAIGLLAAVGTIVVGVAVEADPVVVGAVALAQPVLVRQDGQRAMTWAQGRPSRSLTLDGVWIVGIAAGLAVAATVGTIDPAGLVVVWLIGGVASAAAGLALVEHPPPVGDRRRGPRAGPDPSPEPGFGRDDRRPDDELEARLHGRRRSQALLTTGRNLLPIVVAVLLGPAAAGLLKASILIYTPVLSLVAGLRMVILPALQRAAERPPPSDALDGLLRRLLSRYLVGIGAAVVATLGLVLAALDAIGPAARPDALPATTVLAWGGVVSTTMAVSTLLADGVGFGRRPVPVVTWRVVEIVLEWGIMLAVGWLLGADRIAGGWAVGVAVGALLWLALARTPAPDDGPASGPDGDGATGPWSGQAVTGEVRTEGAPVADEIGRATT